MGSLRMYDEENKPENFLHLPSLEFWGLVKCTREHDDPEVWVGMVSGNGELTDTLEPDMVVMICDDDNQRDMYYAIVREIEYADHDDYSPIEALVSKIGYTKFAIYNGGATAREIHLAEHNLPGVWKRISTKDAVVDELVAHYGSSSNEVGFKALRLELLPGIFQPAH